MTQLALEMWILLAAAFLIGGVAGAWIASARGTGRLASVEAPAFAESVSARAAAPAVLLTEPDGEKDDLTQIIGVDPTTESRLNELGVFYFNQISNWDESAARWIEIRLNEPGRVIRERWTEQATALRR